MGIEGQIACLEALVVVDAAIQELSERIEKERGDLDVVRVEVGELVERLETDRASVAEMDKTRSDLVLELRQLDKQIERSRDRLQRSRNEREVNAAERELDELRKLQRDRDDEIKRIVGLSELARTSIEENSARHQELSTRLEGSLDGANKIITELEQKLEAEKAGRVDVVAKLPNLTRRRYQSMRDRGKLPIAKSHNGTCLGCFVGLPPMMFHTMLSRTTFEECPNCHRILYYEPPPDPNAEPPAEAADAEAGVSEAGASEAGVSEAGASEAGASEAGASGEGTAESSTNEASS